MNKLLLYLDELFPNPKCELNYNENYELLLAVVLSAQSTDKRVNSVTLELFKNSLKEIRDMNLKDIENIIRVIGTYKNKARYIKKITNILIEEFNGKVPLSREELIKLPGVGRKTANVVLSELFKKPAIAVDTHVKRVSKRLEFCNLNDDVYLIENKLMTLVPKEKWSRFHLQMVLFGRYHCKARNPDCSICKLNNICNKKGL